MSDAFDECLVAFPDSSWRVTIAVSGVSLTQPEHLIGHLRRMSALQFPCARLQRPVCSPTFHTGV